VVEAHLPVGRPAVHSAGVSASRGAGRRSYVYATSRSRICCGSSTQAWSVEHRTFSRCADS